MCRHCVGSGHAWKWALLIREPQYDIQQPVKGMHRSLSTLMGHQTPAAPDPVDSMHLLQHERACFPVCGQHCDSRRARGSTVPTSPPQGLGLEPPHAAKHPQAPCPSRALTFCTHTPRRHKDCPMGNDGHREEKAGPGRQVGIVVVPAWLQF